MFLWYNNHNDYYFLLFYIGENFMEREYIAFISYRHLDLDRAVAERLHRLLENYKIPRGLRKSKKDKSLGIVFRDKDELPLSSDLTQDIYHALDHAQYLIVVCTPETPKSKWVRSEIKYFLKNHDRNRIITVLAAGTPEESIPEEITTVYEADGETVAKYIEPLCAYLVAPTKQQVLRNLKEEFIRLVAAMIGCPYDALRQRQRKYRQKRRLLITSLASVIAISFIVMLTIKNQQIQEQLNQTQLSESRALALLSESNLNSGDRVSALKNAVAALPSEEEDRPYVAQAKTALANALYVYDGIQYRYLSKLEETGLLWELGISPSGKYAIMDVGGEIKCYNIQNGQHLWSYFPEEIQVTESFYFLEEENAVLCDSCGDKARLFAIETGDVLFTYNFENAGEIMDVSHEEDQFVVKEFLNRKAYLYFCNLKDGSMICTEISDMNDNVLDCEGTYSGDKSEFAVIFNSNFGNGQEVRVAFFNTKDGALERYSTILYCEEDFRAEESEILALEDNTYVIAFTYPYDYNIMHISESGSVLAQGYVPASTESRRYWSLNGALKMVEDSLVLIYENWIVCIDPYAMSVIREDYVDDSLKFQMLSSNGSLFYTEENVLYEYKISSVEEITLVEEVGYDDYIEITFQQEETSVFAVTSTAPVHIQFYQKMGGDIWNKENELPFTISNNYQYLTGLHCDGMIEVEGTKVLLRDADGNGNNIQFVYDIEEGRRVDTSEALFSNKTVFTSDGNALLDGTKIYTLSDDKYTDFEGASKLSKEMVLATVAENDILPGKPVLTAAYDQGTLHYWKDGKDHKEVEIDHLPDNEEDITLYSGANGLILIHFSGSDEAYVFDTSLHKLHELKNMDIENVVMGRSHPIVAIYNSEDEIELYDFSSGVVHEAFVLGPSHDFAYGLFWSADSKLICFNDVNSATVIDVDSGETVSQFEYFIEGSAYYSAYDYLCVQEDEKEEYLYMWNSTGTSEGIMIDLADWSIVHKIPNMLGYLRASDTLLIFNDNYTKVYTQKVYTLEELISLAENILE